MHYPLSPTLKFIYLLPGDCRNHNSQVWGAQMANTKWPPIIGVASDTCSLEAVNASDR